MQIYKVAVNRVMLTDFFSLFFPHLCEACDQPLAKGENILCTHCLHKLPRTGAHRKADKYLTAKFYGKLDINEVFSFLYFRKHSSVQQLLHRLKYKNKPEIGIFLGKLYGSELNEVSHRLADYDFIVPVPLHSSRQRRRGYNQSEKFSKGLGEALDIPVNISSVKRLYKSQTQTRKTRQQRWENVKDIFSISHPEEIMGKKILLTDDIVTTGATIEACAQQLFKAGASKISVITIAVAV